MSTPSCKIALIVVVLSSIISLLCTLLILLRPLLHHHFSLCRQSNVNPSKSGGVKSSNGSQAWKENRMGPSPQPSQISHRSIDAMLAWAYSDVGNSTADKRSIQHTIHFLHAALDHGSQLLFLAVIVMQLIRLQGQEYWNVLNHRGVLFTCAFVLSLRLLVPLATILYTIVSGLKQQHRHSTGILAAMLTLPSLVSALILAAFVLVASAFGRPSSACILLLSVVGLCLCLYTFISIRLVIIQRGSNFPSGSSISTKSRHSKTKWNGNDQKEDSAYVQTSMSTEGTKASSTNPYETRTNNVINKEEQFSSTKQVAGSRLTSVYSDIRITPPPAFNDTQDVSSLWLDQSRDVTHTYDPNFNDDVLLTPPPSAGHFSPDVDGDLCSPGKPLDRGSPFLRISPSAREMMVSISCPVELPSFPLDLHCVLLGLAGVWLVSVRTTVESGLSALLLIFLASFTDLVHSIVGCPCYTKSLNRDV